jgi:O-Antigen ligase
VRREFDVIRDALLAAGVLFATFTQLRPSGVPLGFGEICLAAWLCLTLGRNIRSLLVPIPPALLWLLVFWLLFSAALCVGTATAVIVGERNVKAYFIHDIIAYALVAGISLLAVLQVNAAMRLRRTAWLLVLLGACLVMVQLAQAYGLLPTARVDVWFYDRFIGWTTNANQLGLLCLILVLLSLHLADTSSRLVARLAAIASSLVPVWAGLLSRSDAFLVALILSVCCIAGMKWWQLLIAPRRMGFVSLSVLLAVFALPALVAAATPLAYRLVAEVLTLEAREETNHKLERDVGGRAKLWGQALERGLESRMLGLGPGPHLVRPAELREPRWDWLPDFEAHNTFVDVFLQGGLLATAGLLWLLATAVRTAAKANASCLVALILAMSGFALTHFIVRHPIVWFAMALVLAAGTPFKQRAMVAND